MSDSIDTVLAQVAELQQKVTDQGEILAAMEGLQEEHTKLSELVADLEVKVGSEDEDDDGPGRMPRPTPPFWDMTAEEREAYVGSIRGFVATVLEPVYPHYAKMLPACWPEHTYILTVLECFQEVWMVLYLAKRRKPKVLFGQADALTRLFPGFMTVITQELKNCTHTSAAYSSYLAGRR